MVTITCPNCARQFTPSRMYRIQYADLNEEVSLQYRETLYELTEWYAWQITCLSCHTEFEFPRNRHIDEINGWGELRKK